LRLTSGQFPVGSNEAMVKLGRETIERMKGALEDDLNTAQAQAAIFEMVRAANAAIDAGELRKDDVAGLLSALEKFDEIFAVLADDDPPKMKAIAEWAKANAREKDISQALLDAIGSAALSDADIDRKIAEMEQARKARKFNVSDAIRTELTAAGIIVENTKDGVRWRRK
jgi:cysteinyl-tRNA synthetase